MTSLHPLQSHLQMTSTTQTTTTSTSTSATILNGTPSLAMVTGPTSSSSILLSANSSFSNLSPIVQRKNEHTNVHSSYNRNSTGGNPINISTSSNATNNRAVDFDTTSIASISESSHWSGGGVDDLDNVALVNGSDINAMQNKDWSTYLRMSKNAYNSSEDDEEDDDDDEDCDNDSRTSNSNQEDSDLIHRKNVYKDLNGHQHKSNNYVDKKMNNSLKNHNKNVELNEDDDDDTSLKDDRTISASHQPAFVNKKNSIVTIKKTTTTTTGHANKSKNGKLTTQKNVENAKSKTNKQPTINKRNKKKSFEMDHEDNTDNDEVDDSYDICDSATGVDEQATSKRNCKQKANSNTNGNHRPYQVSDEVNSSANYDESEKNLDQENGNEDDHLNEEDYEENEDGDGQDDESNNHNEDEDDEEEEDDDDEDEDDEDEDDDDLDNDNIWTIKPKLLKYYEKQFKTMQPNLNGFITGAVARPFFERSKLPVDELSKIWELSDVTKDGALSFSEFCTAMHLVVLRVRNFDLPDQLPSKLQPYAPLIDFNSETNLLDLNKKTQTTNNANIEKDMDSQTVSTPIDSANSVGGPSAGPKPVMFSVKPQVQMDTQVIHHPVPLRYNNNANQAFQQSISENRHSRNSSPSIMQPQTPMNTSTATYAHQMAIHQQLATPNINSVQVTTPATITAATPKLHQPPQVPPRIISPPTTLNSNQLIDAASGATSAASILPPPPPPLSHPHLHHYQHQQQHSNRTPQMSSHQHASHHHHVQHSHAQSYAQYQQTPSLNVTSSNREAPLPPLPLPPSTVQHGVQHQTPNVQSANSHPVHIQQPYQNTLGQQALSQQQQLQPMTYEENPVITLEKLIEQMSNINFERLKIVNDFKQTLNAQQASIATSNEIDKLKQCVRTQTDQNQVLKRMFNELEKELRSLTENRIELEIKLDYLNTAAITNSSNATTNQPQQQSLQQQHVTPKPPSAVQLQSNTNMKPSHTLINSTPTTTSSAFAPRRCIARLGVAFE